MKLAIVHDWLTGMRGGEKCLEIVCRRFPDAELFTLLHVRGSTSPAIERMRVRTSFLQRLPGVGRYYRYLLPAMPAAVERLRLPRDVDLVLSFSHAVAKSARVPAGVPHVCYCFTPMRYAWDLRHEYVRPAQGSSAPGWRGWGRWTDPRDMLLDRLRDWDRATSDPVTHFLAASQTVAQRIERSYGRTSRVIYPPVDTRFFTPAAQPREAYYLCVSALVAYKRIELAIEACQRLGRRLVIVGEGPERHRLARLAGPNTVLLGWQSNEQIREHLRRSRGLLFPGYEDFGIVPVEAQACGTPVVALRRGGATETIVEATDKTLGTGVFFDGPHVDSLAEAILWLERHRQQLSPELARQQAERFNADRFERQLVGFLEDVARSAREAAEPPRAAAPPRSSAATLQPAGPPDTRRWPA